MSARRLRSASGRWLPIVFATLALAATAAGGAAPVAAQAVRPIAAPAQEPPGRGASGDVSHASAVAMVGLTVSDMDRSVRFYSDVLGFIPVSDRLEGGAGYDSLLATSAPRLRVVRLRLGDELLELTRYPRPGRPAPQDARSNDRWFQHVAVIVSDMPRAYARLRAHGVEAVSMGPQRLPDWNPNAGGIEAFYFHDPDGHPLEILHFPPGKGAARWHRPAGDRLFLGIDHSAIVVGRTAQSLAFYQGVLGLRIAGRSENYGPEQARLNAVPGARLRITSLHAPAGPGVEFLEYLEPAGGRPYPPDERADDLVHWQTTVCVRDIDAVRASLEQGGGHEVSPRPITIHVAGATTRQFLVRDPDGHAVRLVEGCRGGGSEVP